VELMIIMLIIEMNTWLLVYDLWWVDIQMRCKMIVEMMKIVSHATTFAFVGDNKCDVMGRVEEVDNRHDYIRLGV
jgi:hypothetical protein